METNRAQFTLEEGQSEAEAEVFKPETDIEHLYCESDVENAVADIVISDIKGNVIHRETAAQFAHGKFGKRLSLPLTDNKCIIKVENVKNAKRLNVYVE